MSGLQTLGRKRNRWCAWLSYQFRQVVLLVSAISELCNSYACYTPSFDNVHLEFHEGFNVRYFN